MSEANVQKRQRPMTPLEKTRLIHAADTNQIETLPVPSGVTFGQLIREIVARQTDEKELTHAEKEHVALYARYMRRYGRRFERGHPIHADIRHWELHVCGFEIYLNAVPSFEAWWFEKLNTSLRRALCKDSREARRINRQKPQGNH